MKYHILFKKLGKILQNVSSTAVVFGTDVGSCYLTPFIRSNCTRSMTLAIIMFVKYNIRAHVRVLLNL